MFGSGKPRFIRPNNESLYPTKNKDGTIELLIKPNSEQALSSDADSKTNFVYNRYHHLPLETQRQRLPVFQYRNHILYLMENYQTVVLVGETGSGKSTQVPQYAYEVGHAVCVTQPRVAAALSLAARVADERGEALGAGVGYAAGMLAQRSPETRIVFMTEGVLLREMFASPLLMQYSCIVLDEVHERTQMTDVLMGLLKKIARKRKKLKIIVSSATMDAEFMKDFFNLKQGKERSTTSTSTIMTVQGRPHPIEVFYTEEPVADYVKATIDTVIKIHENEPLGDILAFLTSQEEILSALQVLLNYAEENNETNRHRKQFPSGINAYDLSVLPMYGCLPVHKQIKVFQMAERNVRKVILATNIAETSITIPGIVYVIDCGFRKLPYFDPALGVERAAAGGARDAAAQRAGRAGRTRAGRCYRLYTEAEYEKLPATMPPEMLRSDLSSVSLQLKALGIDNLLRFSFPSPPPARALLAALGALRALRALDGAGRLTAAGARAAELPLRPPAAALLAASDQFGCIEEALTVVSMLQVDNIFVKSGGKENIAAKISRRNNFEVAEGDVIMYLNIFDAYARVKKRCGRDEKRAHRAARDWCTRMYINHRVLEKASEIRDSLEKIIKGKFKLEDKPQEDLDLGTAKCTRIMKCVLSGFFQQAAYLHADGSYRSVQGAELHISPDSCLYNTQQPKWVIFCSVQNSHDKTYMRELMAIKKEWLLEVAPHYYRET